MVVLVKVIRLIIVVIVTTIDSFINFRLPFSIFRMQLRLILYTIYSHKSIDLSIALSHQTSFESINTTIRCNLHNDNQQ